MDPQLHQALQAASLFASPRAAAPPSAPTWQPVVRCQFGNMRPTTEAAQRADSLLGQQLDAQTDAGGDGEHEAGWN
eukprot:2305343-Pyramimonas_sp.AAC.1